jgi:hypothetical protein
VSENFGEDIDSIVLEQKPVELAFSRFHLSRMERWIVAEGYRADRVALRYFCAAPRRGDELSSPQGRMRILLESLCGLWAFFRPLNPVNLSKTRLGKPGGVYASPTRSCGR